MPRRKLVEEAVSHDRWLVSYADFITLLFGFFVVMYSVSQVHENKYRVLSNTLTEAFNLPARSLDPLQIGEIAKSNPLSLIELDEPAVREQQGAGGGEAVDNLPGALVTAGEEARELLAPLLETGKAELRGNEDWLEIELQSALLFDSGEARLTVPALKLLGDLAGVVKTSDHPLRVEGFTDDRPIRSARFPSNWELSSARATAVVRLFAEEGIDPERMAAVGYGEFQPVADNDTQEGRARNRRVVLMLSRNKTLRPEMKSLSAPDTEPVVEAAPTAQPPDLPDPPEPGNLSGVRRVEKAGGGVLFTSDSDPSSNDDDPREGATP